MAALGYDAAMVLADAIKRAGTTDGAKAARRASRRPRTSRASPARSRSTHKRNATKPAVILKIEGRQVPVRRDGSVALRQRHGTDRR